MPVRKLLQREVLTLPPDATCVEAARLMEAESVGAVVVAVEGRPHGIVTDRDLAVRVMARGLSPRQVQLKEVMSGTPIYLSETRTVGEFIATMRELAVRRVMVVDDEGRLTGLLSLDDLLVLMADEVSALASVARHAVEGGRHRPRPAEPELLDED